MAPPLCGRQSGTSIAAGLRVDELLARHAELAQRDAGRVDELQIRFPLFMEFWNRGCRAPIRAAANKLHAAATAFTPMEWVGQECSVAGGVRAGSLGFRERVNSVDVGGAIPWGQFRDSRVLGYPIIGVPNLSMNRAKSE